MSNMLMALQCTPNPRTADAHMYVRQSVNVLACWSGCWSGCCPDPPTHLTHITTTTTISMTNHFGQLTQCLKEPGASECGS
jgi:hypothetical protein